MFISNRVFGLMLSALALVVLYGCGDKNNPSNGGAAYTLTVAATPAGGGDVSLSPDKERYDAGERVTATASPKNGYEFTGWSGAVAVTSSTVTVTMDGSKALTANFSERKYALTTAVSPEGCGEVVLTPDRVRYDVDAKVRAEAIPKRGCKFEGWSGASTAKDGEVTITVNDDKTLTARFSASEYKLTANVSPSGGGSVLSAPAGSSHRAWATVYLTAVAGSGYEFIGWSGSLESANSVDSVIMDGDRAVTANFARIYTLKVGVSAPERGSVLRIPEQTGYGKGAEVTVKAVPKEGYVFSGWTDSTLTNSAVLTVTMDGDKEFTANFVRGYKLTIEVIPEGAGSVSYGSKQTIFAEGTELGLKAKPNAGYWFREWSGDILTKRMDNARVIMDSDKKVIVVFGGGPQSPVDE
jgi:uncharacterized repeat protein (TIGR02543 family)